LASRNEEDAMAGQLVVGLYESRGYAQDAHNRLHTEGMEWSEMALVVIHDTAALPEHTREEESAALLVSPLVLGDVENIFAQYIKNGETAVIVSAPTAVDVEFATDILSLYEPLAIEVLVMRTATE
jgi:hypothetical protein